ncbi:hypothetical protein [Candidatus Hodarchaeum mangrovi]|nr:hypothetical protein [Asgard group archaeon]
MEVIVVFNQISLAFIRMIGLGVGIDFLIQRKNKRFKAQVAGWSIWTFGSILQLISQFSLDVNLVEIFDFLFGISTLVGSFLISTSIIVYFYHIPVKTIFFVTLVLIVSPLIILIIFNLSTAVTFSILGSFLILMFLYIFGLIEGQNFKETVGESVKWFYAMVIVGTIHMVVFSLFTLGGINLSVTSSQIEDLVALTIINSFAIAVTVMTVVLLIHLENSRSNLYNFQLKDKYSHDLANIIQIIASAIHLIEKDNLSVNEKEKSVELLDQKLQEVLELLQEIRTLE